MVNKYGILEKRDGCWCAETLEFSLKLINMDLLTIAGRLIRIGALEESLPHTVSFRWLDPVPGGHTISVNLTKLELDKLTTLINWLRKDVGDQWGDAVARIAIDDVKSQNVDNHLSSFNELLDVVAEQIDYDSFEKEGSYLKSRNPILDDRDPDLDEENESESPQVEVIKQIKRKLT